MTNEPDPKKPDDVLASIIGAAIKNFAEKGYEGARVDEIAHDAGVNKATIYYHVGDKEALYKAVLSQVLLTGAEVLKENVEKAPTPQEKVAAYVGSILNHVLKGREDFSRIMMREMAGGGANIPPEVFAQIAQKILGSASSLVAGGVREGSLAPVNPILFHMMIVGGIAFLRSTEALRAKHQPPMDGIDPAIVSKIKAPLEEQITSLLLYGLLPRDGKRGE